MPIGRDLRSRVTSLFELPGDVMLDAARLTLVGDMELLVENHRGIREYTPERVVLASPQGTIVVEGTGLEIGSISPDQVTVLGRIRAFRYAD